MKLELRWIEAPIPPEARGEIGHLLPPGTLVIGGRPLILQFRTIEGLAGERGHHVSPWQSVELEQLEPNKA